MALSILYVNGTPRSGTTLLMGLLRAFNNVAFVPHYPYEHRFAAYLAATYQILTSTKTTGSTWDFEEALADNKLTPFPFQGDDISKAWFFGPFRRLLREFLSQSLERLATQQSNDRGYTGSAYWWAEKFPGLHENSIYEAFSSFHLVSIIRNPLDIVASRRRLDASESKIWVKSTDRKSAAEEINEEIRKVADIIEAHNSVAGRLQPPHLLLRYEDVTANKIHAVQKIRDAFGFSLDFASLTDVLEQLAATAQVHSSTNYAQKAQEPDTKDALKCLLSAESMESLKSMGYLE